MIKEGRTMRQALDAGNAYMLDEGIGGMRDYFPPACETAQEVYDCFVNLFKRQPRPGSTIQKLHKRSRIGCMIVESEVTL